MADYKPAFDLMIRNEDPELKGNVYTDNNGGMVRFGLNSKAHPSLTAAGFYTEPYEAALAAAEVYYRTWYWNYLMADLITDQSVAVKFFDQSVPMGVIQASKLMQRTLNKMPISLILKVDGHPGPKTIYAINSVSGIDLLTRFKGTLINFYKDLVETNPADAQYLDGWITRAEK